MAPTEIAILFWWGIMLVISFCGLIAELHHEKRLSDRLMGILLIIGCLGLVWFIITWATNAGVG